MLETVYPARLETRAKTVIEEICAWECGPRADSTVLELNGNFVNTKKG